MESYLWFCSVYEPRPSENDLVDHMNFINEIVKRDGKLAQSKVCWFLVVIIQLACGTISDSNGSKFIFVIPLKNINKFTFVIYWIFRRLFSIFEVELHKEVKMNVR